MNNDIKTVSYHQARCDTSDPSGDGVGGTDQAPDTPTPFATSIAETGPQKTPRAGIHPCPRSHHCPKVVENFFPSKPLFGADVRVFVLVMALLVSKYAGSVSGGVEQSFRSGAIFAEDVEISR